MRDAGKVPGVSTASGLLGKGSGAEMGIVILHVELRLAIRSVAFGLMYDCLTHAIPPCLWNDNGSRFEEDPTIQGLVEGV